MNTSGRSLLTFTTKQPPMSSTDHGGGKWRSVTQSFDLNAPYFSQQGRSGQLPQLDLVLDPRARRPNCQTSGLLNGREQPIAPTRTHEGPQFGDLTPLAAFDGLSSRALDHTVLKRKVHGHGRIIGVAFAPGFRQITS